MARAFLLTFIPLFVAVDIVGVLPLYFALTSELSDAERHQVGAEATLTAAAVGVAFLFVGDGTLHMLGVTVGDFEIGGGLLLVVLAVHELLHPELPLRQPGTRFGVMPLGIPMIVGPAVLTSLLALARTQGYALTLAAFGANLAIVWGTLHWAPLVGRMLGEAGSQAVAKISNLLLTAIGIHLMRQGILHSMR